MKGQDFLEKGQQHLTAPTAAQSCSRQGRALPVGADRSSGCSLCVRLSLDVGNPCLELSLGLSEDCLCQVQRSQRRRQSLENPLGELQSPGLFWLCSLRTWRGVCRELRCSAWNRPGEPKKSCWLHRFFLRSQEASGLEVGVPQGCLVCSSSCQAQLIKDIQ